MNRREIISAGIGLGLGCAIYGVVSGTNPVGGVLAFIGLSAAFLAHMQIIGRPR